MLTGLLVLGASPAAAAADFQHPPVRDHAGAASAAKVEPVDLNNASRAELMKLPGIGAAEAERILRGRPYLSKASIVTRQVLPAATYDSLRGRIFVGPVKGKTGARVAKAASKP